MTGGTLVPVTPQGAAVAAIHETAASAVAAQAKATVEARYVVALRQPRSWDTVRQRILEDCRRPAFAEGARYAKPLGGGKTIDGLSIRFVESALRAMGNVLVESPVTYEDDEKRIVRVLVTDLEANITYQKDITVAKTVERRALAPGQVPLSSRTNSEGAVTYLVAATEDALATKEGAMISKVVRTLGLRILPGDLQAEAEEQIIATLRKRDAEEPDAQRKRIADAFWPLGVSPDALAEYLGHPLAQCNPAELAQMRALYTAIKDGETTWALVMEQRAGARASGTANAAAGEAAASSDAKAKGTEALAGKLAGTAKATAATPPKAQEG
jgi:hypothetical protein